VLYLLDIRQIDENANFSNVFCSCTPDCTKKKLILCPSQPRGRSERAAFCGCPLPVLYWRHRPTRQSRFRDDRNFLRSAKLDAILLLFMSEAGCYLCWCW